MFGSKEASEDKLKKMVEKGKWDKLRKQYLDSDKTTQVALAKACAASINDGSVNILTSRSRRCGRKNRGRYEPW